MADKNTTIPRTMIDCFTQDALTQIKDTLNGDEVTFPNRGGLGTDVRYLSDFALEQIKSAVGNGGGGGGDVRIVANAWELSINPITGNTCTLLSLDDSVSSVSAIVLITDDDVEPTVTMPTQPSEEPTFSDNVVGYFSCMNTEISYIPLHIISTDYAFNIEPRANYSKVYEGVDVSIYNPQTNTSVILFSQAVFLE